MPIEKKSGIKIESRIAASLHKRWRSKLKRENISGSQWLRDQIQKYVKS